MSNEIEVGCGVQILDINLRVDCKYLIGVVATVIGFDANNNKWELNIKLSNGCNVKANPECLKRLPDDEASWEAIEAITNWNPEKVGVEV